MRTEDEKLLSRFWRLPERHRVDVEMRRNRLPNPRWVAWIMPHDGTGICGVAEGRIGAVREAVQAWEQTKETT